MREQPGRHLIAGVVVILPGLALLLFGVWDLLVPRARFVSSNPPAGAIVTEPPSSVTITFSNKLAPESNLDVTSTIRLLPSGESEYLDGSSVVRKSGIDGDASDKSMGADLRPDLHKGLYWVSWRTKSDGWGTITYGKTYFTVGMPAPENITRDMDGAVWERNYQWRRRRGALVGGIVMILLGLLMWKSKQ
ncbi:MAG: copper resistance protein CopC [Acidobacteriota bacterium]